MAQVQGWNRIFVIVAVTVLVLLFYFSASGHFGYTPDESFIYFQYARNLTQGEGPSFNAGAPAYGFTSPLWLLILSAGGAAGVDVPLAAKILDLLFASLSVLLLFFLAAELTRDIAVSFCAALAFSVNAWLLRWAGSGLDASLTVFLLIAFFLYLLRNEYPVAAGILGLMTLAFPAAVLLVVPFLYDLRLNSIDRTRALRTALRVALVWLVIVLPWFIYAFAVFGTIIPAAYAARFGALFDPAATAAAAKDLAETLASADGVSILVMAGSLLILVIRQRKRRAETRNSDELGSTPLSIYIYRQSLAAVVWIVLLPLLCILFPGSIVSRDILPVTPVILVLAFFFLHEVVASRRAAFRYGLVLAFTALVLIQNQFVYKKYVVPHVNSFTEGVESCLRPIGEWLKENTPADAVVMTADVGAIGYYSRRDICDYNGILSPEMVPGREARGDFSRFLRSGGWKEICAPSYIVHRGAAPEELGDVQGLVPVFSRPFSGLSISDPGPAYFTVYLVDHESPDKLLTRR